MVPVRPGPGYSGFPTLDPGTRDLERAHRTAFWTADPGSWSSRELALSTSRSSETPGDRPSSTVSPVPCFPHPGLPIQDLRFSRFSNENWLPDCRSWIYDFRMKIGGEEAEGSYSKIYQNWPAYVLFPSTPDCDRQETTYADGCRMRTAQVHREALSGTSGRRGCTRRASARRAPWGRCPAA